MTEEQLYGYCEIVADIAYDIGYRRLRISNNSREKIGRIIQWAKEFAETHKATDWDETDYIGTIEDFIGTKLRLHLVNTGKPCPHCGRETSLHCEFVDDENDYISVQCCECDQYWEGVDALTALSGVKNWEKKMFGEQARSVLQTLSLDVTPSQQLHAVLKHPKSFCCGVYQDSGKFVAFDNSRGACLVEEFTLLNTAVLWINGEIEISDRHKHE